MWCILHSVYVAENTVLMVDYSLEVKCNGHTKYKTVSSSEETFLFFFVNKYKCCVPCSTSRCIECRIAYVLVRMLPLPKSEMFDWDSDGTVCQKKLQMRFYHCILAMSLTDELISLLNCWFTIILLWQSLQRKNLLFIKSLLLRCKYRSRMCLCVKNLVDILAEPAGMLRCTMIMLMKWSQTVQCVCISVDCEAGTTPHPRRSHTQFLSDAVQWHTRVDDCII